MVNKLEEEPRKYTVKDLDEARHQGYQIAENLYVNQVKNLKERIKELEKNGK